MHILLPPQQCWVIVRPNVLDIFDHEKALRGPGEPGQRRQGRVRENVAFDPGIEMDLGVVVYDALAKKQTVVG